ncbi:MAG: MEDS domain-containing protein [Desulfobulbaceae bacterium]|nr:MEDS domain-containing protein [Desulfobulbaceae bacterium]
MHETKTIEALKAGDHLCCIFESEAEHRALVTPYIRSGLERNERVLYIVDTRTTAQIRRYLQQDGIDPEPYCASGQLLILPAEETYLLGGSFDPETMLTLLRQATRQAVEDGYAALRITGEMTWMLRGAPGSEGLIEYEAKLNRIIPGSAALAICQYDRRRFSPDLLNAVIDTHPFVVIGPEVIENPYYIHPDVYLSEQRPALKLESRLESLRQHQLSRDQLTDAYRYSQETSLRLDAALKAARIGLWDWNLTDDTLHVTLEWEAENGRGLCEEVLDLSDWRARLHPEDLEQARIVKDEAIAEGNGSYDLEYRLLAPDGSYHWFFARASIHHDEDGQPTRIIGAHIDISRHKEMEARYRQARRLEALGRLAGGVAHEYNNMLGVIIGQAEMALEDASPGNPLRYHLEQIMTAATRSANLTGEILAFAQRQTAASETIDLNDIINGLLPMMRQLIGASVTLSWRPGAALWPIVINPDQIGLILSHLCSNARDALAGVGSVVIETGNEEIDRSACTHRSDAVPGSYVVLSINDNGPGMDHNVLEIVFEPFFTTKEVGQGPRLGLPTVHGIVMQNDGFIDVISTPGEGMTFRLYFPAHHRE